MSEKSYSFQFDGHEYRIDAKQMAAIQRLKDAILSIASGNTNAFGIVEMNLDHYMRCFYFSPDLSKLDGLIESWSFFQKYLQREAVMVQGNAPPENRSLTLN